VLFPVAGKFKVTMGSEKAEAPTIAIYLDNKLVINKAAAPKTTYAINVPAGLHSIKVDNLGADWISIAAYQIEGIVVAPHAVYAVRATNGEMAAGWVHNTKYNWRQVRDNGVPAAVVNGSIALSDLQNGIYKVSFYDCATGAFLSNTTGLSAQNGSLKFDVPTFLWDLAFILEKE
jgi:hypothetical protein